MQQGTVEYLTRYDDLTIQEQRRQKYVGAALAKCALLLKYHFSNHARQNDYIDPVLFQINCYVCRVSISDDFHSDFTR